jgi:quercetin dioxygenase-like cupin family protein
MASPVTVSTWADIQDEFVRKGVRRRGFGTPNVLLVMNELERGMDLAPHTHDFDQIALIIEGEANYHIGGVAYPVRAGSVLLIPASQEHYIEPTGDGKVLNLDVFGPARQDLFHLAEWMTGGDAGAATAGRGGTDDAGDGN